VTCRVLSWDWRGQPNLDALSRILTEVSGGAVYVAEADTGDDQYALAFSDEPITGEQATFLYRARWEDDQ